VTESTGSTIEDAGAEVSDGQPGDTPSASLNRDRDFVSFWIGETTALVGAEITLVALPLVAVTIMGASAFQLGLLGACLRLPAVLYLLAGAMLDRRRRRPVMIVSDLLRVILFAAIPLLVFLRVMDFPILCVLATGLGVIGVFFDVAYQGFVPSLVGRDRIAQANGRLQASQSAAQVAGPSLAGGLVTWMSAAAALFFSGLGCLVSAVACSLIRKPEPAPVPEPGADDRIVTRMMAGLRYITGHPLLRPMVISTGTFMFFWSGIQSLYAFYVVRTLGLGSGVVGLLFALGGVGSVIGASVSISLLMRFGPGPVAIVCTIICNPAFLLIALATGRTPLSLTVLAVSQVLTGLTMPIAGVSMGSVRQGITPENMQSRVAGAFRLLSVGTAPLGALAGGVLAGVAGTRMTMFILAVGLLIPIGTYLASPIRGLKSIPAS
jgi:MFS family permease